MRSITMRWLNLPGVLALLLLAACGSAQATATGTARDTSQASGANGEATTVTVAATDFRFALDKAEVGAGMVTFVLRNDGSSPHDLKVSGNGLDRKTAAIGRGETASLAVELRPGTYRVLCTVPGHELLGMKATITVH
jgi:plastocyanin